MICSAPRSPSTALKPGWRATPLGSQAVHLGVGGHAPAATDLAPLGPLHRGRLAPVPRHARRAPSTVLGLRNAPQPAQPVTWHVRAVAPGPVGWVPPAGLYRTNAKWCRCSEVSIGVLHRRRRDAERCTREPLPVRARLSPPWLAPFPLLALTNHLATRATSRPPRTFHGQGLKKCPTTCAARDVACARDGPGASRVGPSSWAVPDERLRCRGVCAVNRKINEHAVCNGTRSTTPKCWLKTDTRFPLASCGCARAPAFCRWRPPRPA